METDEKAFKRRLLETFQAFMSFCDEHGLSYYAAYGTLLGAIRHDGFIPWDDDIDVFMPREDYERFLSLRNQTGPNFEVVDISTKGYFLYFAKFCNRNTTLVEKAGEPVLGLYIDIFPLDNYDESRCRWLVQHNKAYYYMWLVYAHSQRRYSLSELYYYFQVKDYRSIGICLFDTLAVRWLGAPCRYVIGRFQNKLKTVNRGKEYWTYSYIQSECFPRSVSYFVPGYSHRFEHLTIAIPSDYDAVLRADYGDYMTLPPVSKRTSHHAHYFVDLERRLSKEEIVARLKKSKLSCVTYFDDK